ncbi:MAG: DUF2877 domain-containing protein [Nocardioidaceae bacterium]
MTSPTRHAAAAPAWVAALLAGPERVAPVVHRGADAVYVDVDGAALGVRSAAATAVPCGLRTTLPALGALADGCESARVGDGRVAFASAEVVVTRRVDASVPRLPAAAVAFAAAALPPVAEPLVAHVRAELSAEALALLAAGDPAAVPALLGRGSGLTPVGDDVLAGWIATGGATGAPSAPVVAAVREQAPAATTRLSATLLDCAVRGDVLPQFRRLLLELTREDPGTLTTAVDRLVRVGHTSGAGMVLGTTLALVPLASRSS